MSTHTPGPWRVFTTADSADKLRREHNMAVFKTIQAARAYASKQARTLNHAMGVERANEYGRTVYRVSMIPNKPEQRFGWEMRCEPVLPGDPVWTE